MNAPLSHLPAVRTTCPYCGVGCGVVATPDGTGGAAISGVLGQGPLVVVRACVHHAVHGTTTTGDAERTISGESSGENTSLFGVDRVPNTTLQDLRTSRDWTQQQVAAMVRR